MTKGINVSELQEALHIAGVIRRLFFKAEKLYGDKYDRFSIQIEAGEATLIGHEEMLYEADMEHELCNISELLNGL